MIPQRTLENLAETILIPVEGRVPDRQWLRTCRIITGVLALLDHQQCQAGCRLIYGDTWLSELATRCLTPIAVHLPKTLSASVAERLAFLLMALTGRERPA